MGKPRWRVEELPEHLSRDKKGRLVVAELVKMSNGLIADAPRVYWITNDTPEPSFRGGHYHLVEGKREFLVCLVGRAEIELHSREACGKVFLDRHNQALYVPWEVWHGVVLSPGGVLLSLATTLFHPDESRPEKPCGRHK